LTRPLSALFLGGVDNGRLCRLCAGVEFAVAKERPGFITPCAGRRRPDDHRRAAQQRGTPRIRPRGWLIVPFLKSLIPGSAERFLGWNAKCRELGFSPLAAFAASADVKRKQAYQHELVALRYMRARSSNSTPLFVGVKDHSRTFWNNLRVYWLADRSIGVRTNLSARNQDGNRRTSAGRDYRGPGT
jgi:hypothetical protein